MKWMILGAAVIVAGIATKVPGDSGIAIFFCGVAAGSAIVGIIDDYKERDS